ncbi:MAG: bifunctional diaminohydroxyphosphoribosylaminopyrimidine deaminase/5-amino-6-(5-phosphoribosylamino)uracil reductase RibD [Cypionkella sp.]
MGKADKDSQDYIAEAFAAALVAAAEFAGSTAPNPPVGCVVLDKSGRVLACAAHQRAGAPHAEALAIAQCDQAGTTAEIETIIVTLEPCNHTGRTPPCAEAILRTPARQVWIAIADPNPQVQGGGAARLIAAGLDVRFLTDLNHISAQDLLLRAKRLIAPFAKRALTGLPWVTVKQALTHAGSMIPETGRKTFTSPASLTFAHQLRKRADAILTGSGTVLADAPEFTIRRVPDFPNKHRHLVILDRRNRVPDAYLIAAAQRGFIASRQTDIATALRHLGDLGVQEVLVEAGPDLLKSIKEGGFWDEWVTIQQTDHDDQITTTVRQDSD